jgi:hypothetical protein
MGGEASSFVAASSSVSCGALCVSMISVARGSCALLAYAPVAKDNFHLTVVLNWIVQVFGILTVKLAHKYIYDKNINNKSKNHVTMIVEENKPKCG